MKLCILCEDANVEAARVRLLPTLPQKPTSEDIKQAVIQKIKGGEHKEEDSHLKVPCSVTGELPATHWFCFITVTEETRQKMLDAQLYTVIEEGVTPSEFLAKHGVQRIKPAKTVWSK